MSISDDARKTAAEIEKRGWIQGIEKHPTTGEVCIIGAHNLSQGEDAYELRSIDEPFVHAVMDYVGTRVTCWNDEKGRTKEEVLEMLENVAIKHEADEFRSKPA